MQQNLCALVWGRPSTEREAKEVLFVKLYLVLQNLSEASGGDCDNVFRRAKACGHFTDENIESSWHPGLFFQPVKLLWLSIWSHVEQADLRLKTQSGMILNLGSFCSLPLLSECWDYRHGTPQLALCSAGEGTQGFFQAWQELYSMNTVPGPPPLFCINCLCQTLTQAIYHDLWVSLWIQSSEPVKGFQKIMSS